MRPQQQTLWDWAPTCQPLSHPPISRSPHAPAPITWVSEPQHDQAHQLARKLFETLSEGLAAPLQLFIHNNRRRMLSVKREGGVLRLRLHHMFLGCEPQVSQAISQFIGGDERARGVLKTYVKAHRDAIDHAISEQLRPKGRFHDLEAMSRRSMSLIAQYGYVFPEGVRITWGRHGRGQRSIRLGSYDYEQGLIRVHPALDQAWVPAFFVEYIVYHEALHAVIEPYQDRHRRVIHSAEFLRMERLYARYEEALRWEKANLRRLLYGR